MPMLEIFFVSGVLFGMLMVVCTSSTYYASLGLIFVCVLGSGAVCCSGGVFLCLALALIYLAGMLVVFIFCTALSPEAYPEDEGSSWNMNLVAMVGIFWVVTCFFWSWVPSYKDLGVGVEDQSHCGVDQGAVALMYSSGGGLMMLGAWALLLALFVVLELTRGLSRGTLRAV
uniref:NADH-ubiquinone oxidoreductase chain 6 n=1 Tax=Diretmus argenteus TaxID=88682 RepID=Q8HLN7_DIRAR|nr:NADH dehydrogenase subunit 6 [Diretmus argenteus]BAC23461.1 NADH dehydrogenase subunit 6 [Diretmus argenteus]